jgi:cytosine/uracil/thiamine/allantoin permease
MAMKQETFDGQLLAVLDAATRIVAARVLSMLCLLMTFALFCWAMWSQTVLACVVSGGFAVIVFLPTLIGERRGEKDG